MSQEFIVRSAKDLDPSGVALLLARDKILSSNTAQVQIIQQLPSAESPTRFLVTGDESSLRSMLDEFKPALEIESNKQITPL
jgi:hypothetical protein